MLLTVDKVLLLGGDNADQMRINVPAVLLCIQPRLSCKEVQVAVALEFSPALFALLFICQQPHPIQSMLSLHLDTSNCYSEYVQRKATKWFTNILDPFNPNNLELFPNHLYDPY